MSLVVDYIDEIEDARDEAVTETDPELQLDGWHYRFPWIKTAVGAPTSGDRFVVDNLTGRAWRLWHRFHEIGMVREYDRKVIRVEKSGLLTAHPIPARAGEEYLTISLVESMPGVQIVDLSAGEGFYMFEVLGTSAGGGQGSDLLGEVAAHFSEDTPLDELDIPRKARKSLKRMGMKRLQDLLDADLALLVAERKLSKQQYQDLVGWLGDNSSHLRS